MAPYHAQSENKGLDPANSSAQLFSARIIAILSRQNAVSCILANHTPLLLPPFCASHIAIGDEITFPIPNENGSGAEAYVTKNGKAERRASLYLVPIEYAAQPRVDRNGQSFVPVHIRNGGLGLSRVFIPCPALRQYFFEVREDTRPAKTFYDVLRITSTSSLAEIRVAYKLRALELKELEAPRFEQVSLERGLNILGHPELRKHYDELLSNAELPAIFPYGGHGALLVSGDRPNDGEVFFARSVLAFVPTQARRRFEVLFRNCEFYRDKAFCRDPRRKLQFWLDPALVPIPWDPSWNRWKHLLRSRIEVDGVFVRTGKYKKRSGDWELVDWETALPSRLSVQFAAEFREDLEKARNTYCRFGRHSRALDQIHLCLEHKAIERKDLEKMCSDLGIPPDFDIAQINWRPDYDPFFYAELSRAARRMYLFRDEYIFELETAVIAETPQLGHATYIFAKPRNMDTFLAVYTRTTKSCIQRNDENVAERLGFLRRVVHGGNPHSWLKNIRRIVPPAASTRNRT